MKEKILITGAFGYIGGRVSKYLAETEKFYLCLGTRRKEISKPDWLREGEIVHIDLMSEGSLKSACNGVKYAIHLAALNEIDCSNNSEQAFFINGYGTLRLLWAAQRIGIQRFIYFSTAHVYGSPLEGTITENNIPNPAHPYAFSHKAAEDFVLSAHNQKHIIGIVLRLSNSFGAPEGPEVNRWTLIVNDLCRQAVTEKKLILRSSGVQKRDFITLTDVCRAVLHFLNLPAEKCGDGLFNLGGEFSISVFEMAKLIVDRCDKVLGFKPEICVFEQGGKISSLPLEYSIDRIKSTGFNLERNINREIDEELMFCKKAFTNGI